MKKIMFNDRFLLTEAVLSGRKTQTRRIVSEKLWDRWTDYDDFCNSIAVGSIPTTREYYDEMKFFLDNSPYKVGEVVAVAQSYKSLFEEDCLRVKEGKPMRNVTIKNVRDHPGWANKMFVRADQMFHQIRITNVRVEHLQDIPDDDCIKEGIGISASDNRIGYPFGIPFNYYVKEDKKGCRYSTPHEAYAVLIDNISGRGTFENNPWAFVYDFELVK